MQQSGETGSEHRVKWWPWLVGAAAIAAVALGVWFYLGGSDRAVPAAGAAGQGMPVRRGDVVVAVSGSGTFAPAATFTVTAGVEGTVAWVQEAEETVQAGEVVVQLAPGDLEQAVAEAQRSLEKAQLQLRQAEVDAQSQTVQAAQDQAAAAAEQERAATEFQQAETELQRSQELYGAGVIPLSDLEADQQQYDAAQWAYQDATRRVQEVEDNLQMQQAKSELNLEQARAAQAEAEAALQESREELAAVTVKAPQAGVLASVDVTVGQRVSTGAPLGTIFDPGQVQVTLEVDEVDISRVEPGMPVELVVEAFPEEKFIGTVEQVASQARRESDIAIFDVEVSVKNPGDRLRPGMTADGDIIIDAARGVWVVPLEAVYRQGDASYLRVIGEDGVPQEVPVEVGLNDDINVAVTGELTAQMRVLLPEQPQQAEGQRNGDSMPMRFGPGMGGGRP